MHLNQKPTCLSATASTHKNLSFQRLKQPLLNSKNRWNSCFLWFLLLQSKSPFSSLCGGYGPSNKVMVWILHVKQSRANNWGPSQFNFKQEINICTGKKKDTIKFCPLFLAPFIKRKLKPSPFDLATNWSKCFNLFFYLLNFFRFNLLVVECVGWQQNKGTIILEKDYYIFWKVVWPQGQGKEPSPILNFWL